MLSPTRPLSILCLVSASLFGQSGSLGVFSNAGDIGSPALKGSASFAGDEYRVTGSGANIWGKSDQFQYVWRQMPGNFTITTTVQFTGEGSPHRKAGIMVRQSQGANATFASLMIHGNGMPALQWRSKPGEEVNTFDLPFDSPGTFQIRLVRTGVKMFMYVGKNGDEMKRIANTEVTFDDPVLVGLAVCAHQADVTTTAIFSKVAVEAQPTPVSKAQ